MTRLTCESMDAALRSASALLGLSTGGLERILGLFPDGRLIPDQSNGWEDQHVTLMREALGRDPATLPAVPEVLWFHATRVPPRSTFSEGLLPTDRVVPRLEQHLSELAIHAREVGLPCIDDGALHRLQRKRKGGSLAGPFAFLIREVAATPSVSRNFTRKAPEVVEELAFAIDKDRSAAICAAFVEATQPCLVWFVTRDEEPELLCRALCYVFLALRGDDVERANTNYSGGGRPVDAADIERVEFID